MPTYNKLIRDKIPEVIANTGKDFTTRVLTDEEYLFELRNKCSEELQEYLHAPSDEEAVEELADLLELVYTLAEVHGSTKEELEQIRMKKAVKRGGFRDKLFLVDVDDD